MAKWETAAALQRRKSWRKFVLTQHAKDGGALYKSVQRSAMEPHLTTLHPGPQGTPNNLATRLRQATDTWGALWKGGRPPIVHPGEPLTPLAGADVHAVLAKLSGEKKRRAQTDGAQRSSLPNHPTGRTDSQSFTISESITTHGRRPYSPV